MKRMKMVNEAKLRKEKTRRELIDMIQEESTDAFWRQWYGVIGQMKKRELIALLESVRGMRT